MIVPNTGLTIATFKPFREFLLDSVGDLEIVNIFGAVFADAAVDSCMISFGKFSPTTVTLAEMSGRELAPIGVFPPEALARGNYIINISLMKNQALVSILDLINSNSTRLDTVAEVKVGLKAYQNGKGIPAQTSEAKEGRVFHHDLKTGNSSERYLQGRDVIRYLIDWSGQWLDYGPHLAEPRKPELFNGPRLLVRQIPNKPPYSIHAAYTDGVFYNDLNSNIVRSEVEDIRFLLGVMNSKATTFWFLNTFDKLQRGVFPQFKISELKQFPLPVKATHEDKAGLVELVEQMVATHKEAQKFDSSFWRVLSTEIAGLTHSRVSSRWWESDFTSFVSSITPSPELKSRVKLLEFFDEQRSEMATLTDRMSEIDLSIDREVYRLFGLSDSDVELVELSLLEQAPAQLGRTASGAI